MQLGAPTTHPLAPKIAALHRLHAAGLPVPDGAVLHDVDDRDPARWAAVAALVRRGRVVVRTALFDEDTEATAAAGLGATIPDCADLEAVHRALDRIRETLADPWLRRHLGAAPRAQILVQRQISGPWLAVVAQGLVRHAEIHPAITHEPLAAGATPILAGPLDLLPADLRAALAPICERVTAAMPSSPHGLDLELVADTHGAVWVVQARPLTRPLHPGWPAFAAAATADLGAPLTAALPGLWTLDAEHNPAPLSPAHAGLVRRLAAARPDLVTARVLAGWLYEPTHASTSPTPTLADALQARHIPAAPPYEPTPTLADALHALEARHIPAAPPYEPTVASTSPTPTLADALHALEARRIPAARPYEPTPTLADALHALEARHIPAARAWLTAWDRALAVDAPALAGLLDRACDHLLAVLATYATLRVPGPAAASAAAPLCLQGRRDHLDVLPVAWDIASPPLADLSLPTWPIGPVPSDTHEPSRTLLRELDDHLFALGLAPLRRLWLRAGELLGLAAADVFLLPPEALAAALRDPADDLRLAERRAAHARQADLYPPLQLLNGLPVPAAARTHLQGLAIGPPATGPLHPRRDLADLIARPPPPGAVLAMPALTAQAAVALHALAVRAVCCEHGGALSHAALMARELGLSALVGCRGCTALAPGTRVHLDTRTGRLRPA